MRNFQASSDEFAERCVSIGQKGRRMVGVTGVEIFSICNIAILTVKTVTKNK